MNDYDQLEDLCTTELNKRFKSYTTDPKIVGAQRNFDQVFSKLLIGLAVMTVIIIGAGVLSSQIESLLLLISVYILGMIGLTGYLVYGLRKMYQAHLLVIQAIDQIGKENRQIIDDFFDEISKQVIDNIGKDLETNNENIS